MLESTNGAKISVVDSTVDGSVPYVEVRLSLSRANASRILSFCAQAGRARAKPSEPGPRLTPTCGRCADCG